MKKLLIALIAATSLNAHAIEFDYKKVHQYGQMMVDITAPVFVTSEFEAIACGKSGMLSAAENLNIFRDAAKGNLDDVLFDYSYALFDGNELEASKAISDAAAKKGGVIAMDIIQEFNIEVVDGEVTIDRMNCASAKAAKEHYATKFVQDAYNKGYRHEDEAY